MSSGYRKYLLNTIPRMVTHPRVEKILCASPEKLRVQDWFNYFSNIEFVNCKPFQLFHIADPALHRSLVSFKPDVIFVPVERFFRFNEVPVVNMIQNMEPFVSSINGNPLIERIRLRIQYIEGKKAIKRSSRIIALSKFVWDFLLTRWKIPSEKISLIYHGIDDERKKNGHRPNSIPENWYGQFIFTAGSIRPARGLEDLFLAMEHLVSQGSNTVRLVIAGEVGPRMTGYHKKLKSWILKHNLSSKICWVGGLNDKEMTWCYMSCQAFVMTSRVESFGMIGGEAMAHGCICISADNPCLPEIFRDVAIFYPPKDGEALSDSIQTVLTWGDNQRKVMSEKARKRAAEFSWDVCAKKTVAGLVKAVKR